MMKYRDLIKSFDDFKKKVIEPAKVIVGDVEWLDDTKVSRIYYSNEGLHSILYNAFNNRYMRFNICNRTIEVVVSVFAEIVVELGDMKIKEPVYIRSIQLRFYFDYHRIRGV